MKTNNLNVILGWFILLVMWWVFSWMEIISNRILPTPQKVIGTFSYLWSERNLLDNILFSLKINFLGYIEAVLAALPIGFAVGLSKTGKKLFNQPINALRFIPITALSGLFIAISGLTIWTKVHFLAFGIWVYLVPVIIQRLMEVSEVHLQMMKTLGATKWQIFKNVQWPYVMSRLSDDIRILVGISWTYIIVAELKNVQGGLGSMIWLGERQSNIAIVYAVIIIIVILGVLQDLLFLYADKKAYKFKYA